MPHRAREALRRSVRRSSGSGNVSTYEFPAGLLLEHDLIDPAQPGSRPEVVLPKLVELMG